MRSEYGLGKTTRLNIGNSLIAQEYKLLGHDSSVVFSFDLYKFRNATWPSDYTQNCEQLPKHNMTIYPRRCVNSKLVQCSADRRYGPFAEAMEEDGVHLRSSSVRVDMCVFHAYIMRYVCLVTLEVINPRKALRASRQLTLMRVSSAFRDEPCC